MSRRVVLPVSLALVAALVLTGCAGQTLSPPRVQVSNSGETPFAKVSQLQRGHSVQVPITLNNPHRDAIHIIEITMTVRSVDQPRCPASALRLTKYPKPIIGPESSGVILLTVSMNDSANSACDSASWDVEFASRAEVAS